MNDEVRQFKAFKTGALIPDDINLKYIGMYPIFIQVELMLYISKDKYNLIGNTKNYNLDYDWKYFSRRTDRNHPVFKGIDK